MNTPILISMVVLVLFSAFFSSAETAFSSLNKVKLKAMQENNNETKINKTLSLADNYDIVLSTILIGNNLVNIGSTALATLFFTGLLGDNSDLGATVSTAVMTVVVLVFGEITPKTIAKEKAESYAIVITPIVKLFVVLFYPINMLFRGWRLLLAKAFHLESIDIVTEEELKGYVNEAHTGGEIDENESELIRSSIEFDDLYVSDILTPRVEVDAVDKYAKLEDIEKVFKESNHSRLPVYIGDIDHIVGVIHHRDFEAARERGLKSLRTVLKPVPTISPDTKISRCMRILQKNKTHLAVVVDEFGGTEGIITLEDIIEELVGEIWDEHDEVQLDIEEIGENTYLVDALASLDRVLEFFDVEDEETDVTTVNGWMMEHTDKIPAVGDSFTYENLRFEVLSVDGKRADKIKVTVMPEENDDV